jgi:uncharacterized protein (DUF2267 family)
MQCRYQSAYLTKLTDHVKNKDDKDHLPGCSPSSAALCLYPNFVSIKKHMGQTTIKMKPKTYNLLLDLSRELEMSGDLAKAKAAFETVLHCFAGRLDADKGIEVITNLPVHLKDIFSKGWKPFRPIEVTDFITAVQSRLADSLKYSREQILCLVRKVFSVLAKYIDPDKMARIHSCMNKDLRTIIER